MCKFNKTLFAAVVLASSMAYSSTTSEKDVVLNRAGEPVMSRFGGCVLSSWSNDHHRKCSVAGETYQAMHKIDVVYFGFDKAVLNKDAIAGVHKVYKNISKSKEARLSLVGHTDLVGSKEFNDRLSLRRSEYVKKELVRLGVSSDKIEASGKGFSEPIVATKRGVPNAKNRRVEMFYTTVSQ